MGRIGRSVQLVGQSYRILMQDDRYATDGEVAPGFDRALFDQAFVEKKRR